MKGEQLLLPNHCEESPPKRTLFSKDNINQRFGRWREIKNIELEYWHKVVNEYAFFAVYFLPILSVIFDHNCIGATTGVTSLLTC